MVLMYFSSHAEGVGKVSLVEITKGAGSYIKNLSSGELSGGITRRSMQLPNLSLLLQCMEKTQSLLEEPMAPLQQ